MIKKRCVPERLAKKMGYFGSLKIDQNNQTQYRFKFLKLAETH